jgi:hypothetical protein
MTKKYNAQLLGRNCERRSDSADRNSLWSKVMSCRVRAYRRRPTTEVLNAAFNAVLSRGLTVERIHFGPDGALEIIVTSPEPQPSVNESREQTALLAEAS